MCVNDVTAKFHVENDCTNTVIVVPKQPIIENNNTEYKFVFQIQQYMNLSFKLKYGLSFMFIGKYLTHRQQCSKPSVANKDLFFNIASYRNKHLFNHLKQSFNRNGVSN